MLHLTQMQGGTGAAGADDTSPQLDINLAAFESSLRGYIEGDDTQQPFDVVSGPRWTPLMHMCTYPALFERVRL
jgi:hypothetical protein